jgi:hypothetical protein
MSFFDPGANFAPLPPGFELCPCCQGERYLFVQDENFPTEPPQRMLCNHCCHTGTVKVQDSSRNTPERETYNG